LLRHLIQRQGEALRCDLVRCRLLQQRALAFSGGGREVLKPLLVQNHLFLQVRDRPPRALHLEKF
jgi:hypothetical protein